MRSAIRNIAVICVGAVFFMSLAACRSEEAAPEESVFSEAEQDPADMEGRSGQPEEDIPGADGAENAGIREADVPDSGRSDEEGGDTDPAEGSEHLAGKVSELTPEGMVIIRTVILEGSTVRRVEEQDAQRVSVLCTPDTRFEHWVIQGGGAGIDRNPASFSDITEGMMLELSGYYEGSDFIAELVLIEEDE